MLLAGILSERAACLGLYPLLGVAILERVEKRNPE